MTVDQLIKALQLAAKTNPHRIVKMAQYDEIDADEDGNVRIIDVIDYDNTKVILK